MRMLISLLSLLCAMGTMAQLFHARGNFTSDTSGTEIEGAFMNLSLAKDHDNFSVVSLEIYKPGTNYSLVDTLWRRETAYRTDKNIKSDTYEERDILFLYTFNSSGHLDSYYIFSQIVDTTQDDVTRIVVRKLGADEKRLWSFTSDAAEARAKEFTKILSDARKKLRFKKTTAVKDEDRDKEDFRKQEYNQRFFDMFF